MEIQKATPKDIKTVCDLYHLLFCDMAQQQPAYFHGGTAGEDWIQSIIDSDKEELLIAAEQGEVLGFAHLEELQSPTYGPFLPRRYVLLMDLVVAPDYRSKGVGTMLIEEAKDWGRARGLDYIELAVLQENAGAFKLYQREGFQTVMQTMKCALK